MSVTRTAKPSPPSPTPSRGRANLAKLRRVTEAEIRRSSPDELRDLPAGFWVDAVPVEPAAKIPISLRVDSDVLEFFREGGPRYQSRMNAVLRSYMERTSASLPKRSRRRGLA